MEIWKPVVGFEGIYEVSSAGRLRQAGGRLLKPCRLRNGYVQATLVKGGKKTKANMHRLVAFAFLEKPEGAEVVNHKNANPSDNRVENLEWCTQSENVKYIYKIGNDNNAARKKTVCIETGMEFYSSVEAATWVNGRLHDSHNIATISRTIRSCANGDKNRPRAYGYRWKFSNGEGSTTIPSRE